MLRRKLLLILGSLITLWLLAALAAVMLLDNVLRELDDLSTLSNAGSSETTALVAALNSADLLLIRSAGEGEVPLRMLETALRDLKRSNEEFGIAGLVPSDAELTVRTQRSLLVLITELEFLAAGASGRLTRVDEALAASTALHRNISEYSQVLHDTTKRRQQEISNRFRAIALGLGITFLVLINGSILMLLRASMMILQPVETLVEATRRLAREEFDNRVVIDQHDEFGELARAYNSLAEQLQSNERRKIETLHQVAATLSHELNNAIAIIELQLRFVERRAADRDAKAPLRQIHETLERMRQTIEALKHIRRIVLTDYAAGIKMLDLQRSTADDERPSKDVPIVESTRA